MLYAPIGNPIARANIRVTFHIQNIGKSVAQDIRIITELFFMPNSPAFPAVRKEQKGSAPPKRSVILGLILFRSRSALFPEDAYDAIINATGWAAQTDISKRNEREWVRPVVIGCIAYQFPRDFQTRVAYTVAGGSSNEIEFRKPLSAEEINFFRDQNSEYAQ